MKKLSAEKITEILSLAGAPEATIAKRVGVSRWVVHHYLELAGKTRFGTGKKWVKPAPGAVVRKGTFALYYNKGTARLGYPWVLESDQGTTDLAKEVDIVCPLEDFQSRTAWTSYDASPDPKLTRRPSYVRGVVMIRGTIVVKN
jgi:hypothetical protein